jgi:chromatin modification-related protein VID21
MPELFDPTGSRPINAFNPGLPLPPKDARRRAAEQIWTSSDDLLLKTLMEKYPNNWPLISESFNSSRVAPSTDKRTAWDCRERWSVRWGSGSLLAQPGEQAGTNGAAQEGPTSPVTPTVGQMTTRGVKRLASTSVAANTVSSNGSATDAKKRRSHNIIYEHLRKASKKRESQKNGKTY